jgi:hypothetical protein
MAIKLYKSQLEPTAKSSNVENKAFVSMDEAASIGKAWKGMVKAGEELYVKHQDIKTDNEILEKAKEVMNGSDKFEGLSSVELKASQMHDPDAAGKLYNDHWQTVFDTVNGSLSNNMAKNKFKVWMTKQNLKDVNAIKIAATTNMINKRRLNTLEEIETLKKSILHGKDLEQKLSTKELADKFSSQKYFEIFGNTLPELIKETQTEIKFFQYKNVPIEEQEAALAAAKKDPSIPQNGPYSVDALELQFNSKKTTIDHQNRSKVNQIESNVVNGYTINQDEFAEVIKIATDTGDEKSLIKIQKIIRDYPIYQQLSQMPLSLIKTRKNILTEFKGKKAREGKGMKLEDINNLEITTKYLAALTIDINKDQLMAANDRNIVSINDIGFTKLLSPDGNISDFIEAIKERVPKAKTVAGFWSKPVIFFTENEKNAIGDAFKNASTPNEIIQLSTVLVQGFGTESDKAFQELSKDNTILAHIGGLTIMNNGVAGKNVKLAVEGYLLSKEPELSKAYLMKSSDLDLIPSMAKFNQAFSQNRGTFNNTVEAANFIYAAQLKSQGKTKTDFDTDEWENAFALAAGATIIEGVLFDKQFGGFAEDTRGNLVHIPPWLPNDKFDDVIELFNADKIGRSLFKQASSNGELPVVNGVRFTVAEIFLNQPPYFVSVDDGKYKIAMGENPNVIDGEHEWLMNSDGGFFVINLNNIKSEILTDIQ